MVDWKTERRQGECHACARAFASGEAVFSMLHFEGEELRRGDLCSACFDRRDPADDLVWWRTSHQDARGGLRLDYDLILALLGQLEADSRPERLDLRFLLALLLVRHRKLRLVGVRQRGAREFLHLRKVRSQATLDVEVRELAEERRQQLTQVLSGLLDPTADTGLDALLGSPAPSGLPTASPAEAGDEPGPES